MQDFLKSQWQDVKDGLLSRTLAAVITNVAVELASLAEEALVKMSEGRLPTSSYRALTAAIRPVPDFKTGTIHVAETDVGEICAPPWGVCLPFHLLVNGKDTKVHFSPFGNSNGGSEEIGVGDVFKARVLLDILGILGADNETAYTTLRQSAATAQYHFGIIWQLDREIAEGLVLPDNLAAELCKKYGSGTTAKDAFNASGGVHVAIKNNPFVQKRQAIAGSFKLPDGGLWTKEHESVVSFTGTNLAKIIPSRDHTFYYNHQPVYSSLETIRLLFGVSGVGLDMCNNFHSFVSVAHLYNAIQQTGEMKQRWVEMENAIAAHVGQLFRGKVPIDHNHI
ncbi:hypothetical protein IFR05_011357 [Cadophora sp. M221]|nr:hypothetical protein IFR05_011357 [Cadophora sp. M221]